MNLVLMSLLSFFSMMSAADLGSPVRRAVESNTIDNDEELPDDVQQALEEDAAADEAANTEAEVVVVEVETELALLGDLEEEAETSGVASESGGGGLGGILGLFGGGAALAGGAAGALVTVIAGRLMFRKIRNRDTENNFRKRVQILKKEEARLDSLKESFASLKEALDFDPDDYDEDEAEEEDKIKKIKYEAYEQAENQLDGEISVLKSQREALDEIIESYDEKNAAERKKMIELTNQLKTELQNIKKRRSRLQAELIKKSKNPEKYQKEVEAKLEKYQEESKQRLKKITDEVDAVRAKLGINASSAPEKAEDEDADEVKSVKSAGSASGSSDSEETTTSPRSASTTASEYQRRFAEFKFPSSPSSSSSTEPDIKTMSTDDLTELVSKSRRPSAASTRSSVSRASTEVADITAAGRPQSESGRGVRFASVVHQARAQAQAESLKGSPDSVVKKVKTWIKDVPESSELEPLSPRKRSASMPDVRRGSSSQGSRKQSRTQ